MAAPCINDTCSIRAAVDSITRQLTLDARLDPTGGLQCIDGRGLGLAIVNDPAAVTFASVAGDLCFHQLGITTAGEVFSVPERARFQGFSSSTAVNIPQGGDEGDESIANPIDTGQTVTNPYDCQAMMLVIGRFRVGYSISTAAVDNLGLTEQTIESADASSQLWIPYNGDVRARFFIDGTNESTSYFDIGGTIPNSLNNSNKRRWEYFVVRRSLAAGATVDLDARANHEGNNESLNISTINPATAPTFDDRGLKCDGEVIIFPFNNEAL